MGSLMQIRDIGQNIQIIVEKQGWFYSDIYNTSFFPKVKPRYMAEILPTDTV